MTCDNGIPTEISQKTALIHDPERRLTMFDPNSVYLPTKRIGKNNPKAAELEADNAARQDWNKTADMAPVSGISELKIIRQKNTPEEGIAVHT